MAKNIRSIPSSLYERWRVYPRDCSPVECRANFKIRKILMILNIWTTLRTFWNCSVVLLFVSVSPSEMKYGMMANKSITFKGPLKNFHLLGEAQIRARYSRVNQPMQTASTTARSSLSWFREGSVRSCSAGMVLRVSAIVDSTMNKMEMIATTWGGRGWNGHSHYTEHLVTAGDETFKAEWSSTNRSPKYNTEYIVKQ